MSGIIVQKFGGTSVADTEKIKHVAEVVMAERSLGNDVVVVVSAMGHTTDHLVKLANEISWKDMKEFNSYMKEVVRDYKIKQAKSIQSARNVIIS